MRGELVLLDEAENELIEAIVHYEAIAQELGRRLRDEVTASLAWIQINPQVARLRQPGYYRVNLRAFPYHVPYILRSDKLWILAFAHVRRRPLYWINRKLIG